MRPLSPRGADAPRGHKCRRGGADVASGIFDSPLVQSSVRTCSRLDTTTTTANVDVKSMQRAFLSRLEGDGDTPCCVALGEYRAEEGVFAVEFVSPEHEDLDVAGARLGDMIGGVVALEDVQDAELELEWGIAELDVDLPSIGTDEGGCTSADATPSSLLRPGTPPVEQRPHASAVEAFDVETQTELRLTKMPFAAADIRVREDKDSNGKLGKLIGLGEFLTSCKVKGLDRPPILTPSARVREAQQSAGAWQAHYNKKSSELNEAVERMQKQLEDLRAQHASELVDLRAKHAKDLEAARAEERERATQREATTTAAMRQWARINLGQLKQQQAAQLQHEQAAYQRELAARAKRAETWRLKRHNQLRQLVSVREDKVKSKVELRQKAAELRDIAADNQMLHAELGVRIKVAEQRKHEGSRAAFTFRTILRDLRARLCTLNAGTRNMKALTAVYSSMIAADGRDLQLESGAGCTVLRWEKTAEVLCLLLEGQQLRNAVRAQPRTRIWTYCDLSPDCRAIEQFGMGIEYAGIIFQRVWGDAEQPSGTDASADAAPPLGRLGGAAWSICSGFQLGMDGCPLVVEWSRRVFAPMLEAVGPKYASTCDCYMRTLQVYGLTASELLDPTFSFATVEITSTAIPLLDLVEGITSDAGGEVHKSGGVIDTVVPNASWHHCGDHCLNLAMRKSLALERAGPRIRSISCFLRGGNKHQMLVLHMERVQDPSSTPTTCNARLRKIYEDAHEALKKLGQFQEVLGGLTASPATLGVSVDELHHVALTKIRRKSKKGTDIRWKYECEVCTALNATALFAAAVTLADPT